jgi:hypothetical protein
MGGTIELPFGLATSAGSLPVVEPDVAVALTLATQPEFPSSPTLGSVEGSLLAQAVEGLPGVQVVPPGLLQVEPRRWRSTVDGAGSTRPQLLAEPLGGTSHEVLRRFLGSVGTARPTVGARLNVLGPVTLALGLRAAGVDEAEALLVAGQVVRERSTAMLAALRASMPDGVVLVCASEPGLIGASHPTFPLTPSQVQELLDPFVRGLDAHPSGGSLLIGVHVPGRTDWSTVIGSGVSVVAAPVEPSLVGWADELGGFLDRGGRIVWGAVPVDQPLGTSEELLWRRMSALWCELVGEGLDALSLRSRSLVAPADGLGHFGVTQAERVLSLVDSLSTRVRRQAISARLTLGA